MYPNMNPGIVTFSSENLTSIYWGKQLDFHIPWANHISGKRPTKVKKWKWKQENFLGHLFNRLFVWESFIGEVINICLLFKWHRFGVVGPKIEQRYDMLYANKGWHERWHGTKACFGQTQSTVDLNII